jgi:hypothetical protein
MPLAADEKVMVLSEELPKEFDIIFGQHPGFRPVHAKGISLTGAFSPSSKRRDGGGRSPARTLLRGKFPANREKYREYWALNRSS